MDATYTARCGRDDRHHAHAFVRTDGPLSGRMAPCVGNDSPRIIGQPAPSGWVARAQAGTLPSKDMTRG